VLNASTVAEMGGGNYSAARGFLNLILVFPKSKVAALMITNLALSKHPCYEGQSKQSQFRLFAC
jgi:hypothetical protein